MGSLGQRVPVGVGVVLLRDGHVLVGKRKGAHGAGKLQLPGGKPDHGEEPIKAAIRELREETGIDLYGLKALPGWSYDRWPREDIHYVTLFFSAKCPPEAHAQTMEPDKCEGWQWMHPLMLDRNDLMPGSADAIQEATGEIVSRSRYDEFGQEY